MSRYKRLNPGSLVLTRHDKDNMVECDPVFNKTGAYFDRENNIVWIETVGKAYMFKDNLAYVEVFKNKLKNSITDNKISYSHAKALEELSKHEKLPAELSKKLYLFKNIIRQRKEYYRIRLLLYKSKKWSKLQNRASDCILMHYKEPSWFKATENEIKVFTYSETLFAKLFKKYNIIPRAVSPIDDSFGGVCFQFYYMGNDFSINLHNNLTIFLEFCDQNGYYYNIDVNNNIEEVLNYFNKTRNS